MKLGTRNLIGLGLLVLSLGLLIPGLITDLLTVDISFSVPLLGKQELHKETRSIIGTIGELYNNGNTLVASLILLFSVVVPFFKAVALILVLLLPRLPRKESLKKFVGLISKWSMADVFVVGVFLCFLSVKSDENVNAFLHEGFYLFTGYCILSILASQVVKLPVTDN